MACESTAEHAAAATGAGKYRMPRERVQNKAGVVRRRPRRRGSLGRRTILLSFTVVDNILLVLYVACAELSPLVNGFKYGCLVLLVAYAFVYGSGVGPISWFISSELVPQKYRSITQSTCYSLNTIIVVILTFSILPLYSVVGTYAFLILYTIPSTISIFILYFYLPETKGREIHEIVAELRGKTKSS
ncbi:hypothetical protein ANCDUO_03491 [Ancylostoma duodenale]|uniref:Major facilitator superfamily (MFS) profile domain-containing protein n=1 Tax=Ancylostoma duodenale TaxID=51022 RepID=A0A0C2GXC3_9BILA|nr:hypothetical protein ANCDUO_03491 [Ancylostoma duodenale]